MAGWWWSHFTELKCRSRAKVTQTDQPSFSTARLLTCPPLGQGWNAPSSAASKFYVVTCAEDLKETASAACALRGRFPGEKSQESFALLIVMERKVAREFRHKVREDRSARSHYLPGDPCCSLALSLTCVGPVSRRSCRGAEEKRGGWHFAGTMDSRCQLTRTKPRGRRRWNVPFSRTKLSSLGPSRAVGD